jgi:hypothetical protein
MTNSPESIEGSEHRPGRPNWALPALSCCFITATIIALINRSYPFVGPDFAYFIPRMLDADLHRRINGLSVQWYTPTFGGGLPAFFNPQHIQFSLPQLLLIVMDPWSALMLSIALASAGGYAALYLSLRNTLRLGHVPSSVGAAWFLGNGFFIEHAMVGHVGFLLFPLGAVILHALTNRRASLMARSSWVAMILALMIHQAGFFLVLITGASVLLSAQVLSVMAPRLIDWRASLRTLAIAAPLTVGLVASKILAVAAFMRQFPREVSDTHTLGVVAEVVGVGIQLAGGMLITPVLLVGGFPTRRLDDVLILATGAGVHLWELDVSLAPLLSITLVCGLGSLIYSVAKKELPSPTSSTVLAAAALFATVWIIMELTIARGPVYSFLKMWPPLKSLHINQRFTAVFILPLAVLGSMVLDRWFATKRLQSATAFVVLATCAGPLIYFAVPEDVHRRGFDLTQLLDDHQQIVRGERFPIQSISMRLDFETFSDAASSGGPYEPIFGYQLEMFRPKFREGSVSLEIDGRFNMTNPVSLVFPRETGTEPFDLIATTDRANFERLRNRQQPDWPLPSELTWLNRLAVASLVSCVAAIALDLRRRVRGRDMDAT